MQFAILIKATGPSRCIALLVIADSEFSLLTIFVPAVIEKSVIIAKKQQKESTVCSITRCRNVSAVLNVSNTETKLAKVNNCFIHSRQQS